MKKASVFLFLLLCFFKTNSAFGLEILDSNYKAETYVSYQKTNALSRGMAFDSDGNLYITYSNTGTIEKVSPDRTVSTFASGLNNPRGITWGGGTAYGNYLYVASFDSWQINKISTNGIVSTLCSTNGGIQSLEIDRTGNYGGYLYTGTRDNDHLYKVSTAGIVSPFSDFPYGMRGGPTDFAFSSNITYAPGLYVTTDSTLNVAWKGLHILDTLGTPAPLVVSTGLSAHVLEFDSALNCFGGNLFMSKDQSGIYSLCKVLPNGEMIEFIKSTISPIATFTFGSDGAMYVHEFTSTDSIITRISPVPEPCTLLLLGLGGLLIRKR
jgi:hypothetical protein